MAETRYLPAVPGPELGLSRTFLAPPFDVETTDWNQTPGYASGAAIYVESGIARIGWGTGSENLMAVGVIPVSRALVGALRSQTPTVAAGAAMRE